MTNKDDKKIFASIQHSRATLLKLKDVKDTKRKTWLDNFFDEVTKDPAEIEEDIAPFEKAVAKASDTLSLGNNVKFTTAIAFMRKEIFVVGTDAFNKQYYYEVLAQVLEIVQEVLAMALHTFEVGQYLRDAIDTQYIAKSAQILEEQRLTEFLEDDEDYE